MLSTELLLVWLVEVDVAVTTELLVEVADVKTVDAVIELVVAKLTLVGLVVIETLSAVL